MNKILLNADVGEWESSTTRAAIFPHMDLVNIACGGHAGSLELMNECADLAEKFGVKTGAHPGVSSDQGRAEVDMSAHEFTELVAKQLETYQRSHLELNHLKLHGSLYHLSERDSNVRKALLKIAETNELLVIGLAGGKVDELFAAAGLPFLAEAFLDRNYLANGNLVPRTSPDALLCSPQDQRQRVIAIREGQAIRSLDNQPVEIKAETICIHADHPGSAELAEEARNWLELGESAR